MESNFRQILLDGQVVAGATDTVFGLFGDAASAVAIEAIYALKGRAREVPLQLLVNSIDMAAEICEWDESAQALAEVFWPGPLTLVLPRKACAWVDESVALGRETIGVRMPDHDVPLGLIDGLGRPIVATSANLSGALPVASCEEVRRVFAGVAVVDAAVDAGGMASTVVDLTVEPFGLLREGGVLFEELEAVLG